jgi:protein-tyrosine phosphatase
MQLDITELHPGLYVGGNRQLQQVIEQLRPALLVSVLPVPTHLQDVPEVLVVKFSDDAFAPGDDEWQRAMRASEYVAAALRRRQGIYVCCAEGLNRSPLICGVAIYLLTGRSGRQIAEMIRAKRRGSLYNHHFYKRLCAMGEG